MTARSHPQPSGPPRPGPVPPAQPARLNPLTAVAILVVALALVAVAFLVWRQSAGAGAAPPTTARSSAAAKVTSSVDPVSKLPWVEEASLPAPAKRVLAQIDKGGPYDYDKDGTTFRNAEGLLPKATSTFYKEYTVVLPGSNDRGPVRIIVGGKGEFFYWTTDHYASFSRIRR